MNLLGETGNIPVKGWLGDLLDARTVVPAIILVPRFILSLRRTYAREHCGRCETDIDIPLGFTSATTGTIISWMLDRMRG